MDLVKILRQTTVPHWGQGMWAVTSVVPIPFTGASQWAGGVDRFCDELTFVMDLLARGGAGPFFWSGGIVGVVPIGQLFSVRAGGHQNERVTIGIKNVYLKIQCCRGCFQSYFFILIGNIFSTLAFLTLG